MNRLSLLLFFAPLSALVAGCEPEPYTCADPIKATAGIEAKAPIEVDTAQPSKAPKMNFEAYFQVICNSQQETIEIASASIVEFDTEKKILDFPMRYKNEIEETPTCDGVGTSSFFDVVIEGVTNADLAPLCGRQGLGLLAIMKRAGCADTDPATSKAKDLISVYCP